MAVDADSPAVNNNESEHRFELDIDGHMAVIEYRRRGKVIIFDHTKVPDALAGRGIGNKLAQAALGFARDEGLTVIPLCPFVRAYMKRHEEYLNLVDRSYRAQMEEPA